jgi:hypothetical protein
MSERTPDRSRISMKEAHQFRYWTEALGRMSLPPTWREWGVHLMQYGVRFSELGQTGHSDWVLLRGKRHQSEDAHVSKREGAGALKGHHMVRSSPMSDCHVGCLASPPASPSPRITAPGGAPTDMLVLCYLPCGVREQ